MTYAECARATLDTLDHAKALGCPTASIVSVRSETERQAVLVTIYAWLAATHTNGAVSQPRPGSYTVHLN